MEWDDLTYLGKGFISGFIFWLIVVILVGVRSLYLNMNLGKMKPEVFYVFNGSLGFFGILIVGVFLVVSFGIIGWLYGRITGENV